MDEKRVKLFKELMETVQGPVDMRIVFQMLEEECTKRGEVTDGPFEGWFNAAQAAATGAEELEA